MYVQCESDMGCNHVAREPPCVSICFKPCLRSALHSGILAVGYVSIAAVASLVERLRVHRKLGRQKRNDLRVRNPGGADVVSRCIISIGQLGTTVRLSSYRQ